MNQQTNEYFGLMNEKIYSASAHGGLDVMGGIADYSGSLVLQMPIAEKTTVSIKKTEDNLLKIKSLCEDKSLNLQFQLIKLSLF